MPGPEQLVRAAVTLPLTIVRQVVGVIGGLLPGGDDDEPVRAPRAASDLDAAVAADDALTRERDPVEEAPLMPDDDLGGHVEPEIELVAESADIEATEPAGPELHVDEPWEGYRRMKVAEIVAQLEGQPAAVLGAVELYETTHRKRAGVLNAVRAASRA
jgi:hypothetical protein